MQDGRIRLGPDLADILRRFLATIQEIERQIHEEPVEVVQTRLLEFTNQYTEKDSETGDYKHIPYFAEIKHRLDV